MKPQEVFGIIVRTVGLLLMLFGLVLMFIAIVHWSGSTCHPSFASWTPRSRWRSGR
jgi:hypothetical protein